MLIRLAYRPGRDERGRRWRFRRFAELVLPRIVHQRNAAFDLWVWTDPAHRAEVEAMDPRVRTFTVDTEASPLAPRHPWASVQGVPRYPVQIRLDSDDLIGPKFVATALRTLAEMPERRALVHFQPWKIDVATGLLYRSRRYREDRNAAFLALRQPIDDPAYTWVYGRGHIHMHRLADATRTIGLGHCWIACHEHNDTTYLRRRDVLLADQSAARAIAAPWW